MSKKAAREKADAVIKELLGMRLNEAAKTVENGMEETLSCYDFPSEHWRYIRTNNVIERMNRASAQAPSPTGASSADAGLPCEPTSLSRYLQRKQGLKLRCRFKRACRLGEAHAYSIKRLGQKEEYAPAAKPLEACPPSGGLRCAILAHMKLLNSALEETQQGLRVLF